MMNVYQHVYFAVHKSTHHLNNALVSDAKYVYQISCQMCRYAVSVVWELDSRYRVQKVWYGRTIIRSKYKLAYEVVK